MNRSVVDVGLECYYDGPKVIPMNLSELQSLDKLHDIIHDICVK